MKAIWNVNDTAKLSREANLRNTCRQLEQEYVDWSRYQSLVTSQQWPAIGELGRYTVAGSVLSFIRHRSYVEVLDASGKSHGRVPAQAGMAQELYLISGAIEDGVMQPAPTSGSVEVWESLGM